VPNKSERQFHVGQKIRINLHAGRIEDATVKAIVEHTDGLRLQVDFGFNQTALIGLAGGRGLKLAERLRAGHRSGTIKTFWNLWREK
jgi:hypothetical protein